MKRQAFTLTELLVVMGVIAVLATLTLVSTKAISAGARVASAVNTVSAALDNGRALAMRKNAVVLVAFRPRFDRTRTDQAVEIVTATWAGQSYRNNQVGDKVIDRFVPAPDIPIRELPAGISVAAPRYDLGHTSDDRWATQSYLPATDSPQGNTEPFGAMIGVMYGPEGTTISRMARTDGDWVWVDFYDDTAPEKTLKRQDNNLAPWAVDPAEALMQQFENDESLVTIAPFLAVYDDREARKRRVGNWTVGAEYEDELTDADGFIATYGTRVYFNRYTGVVMR